MKTKVNTKKKVSTKPKAKALKQGAVSGSLRVIKDKLNRNEKYKIIKRLCNR
jgi:hypothetical protein